VGDVDYISVLWALEQKWPSLLSLPETLVASCYLKFLAFGFCDRPDFCDFSATTIELLESLFAERAAMSAKAMKPSMAFKKTRTESSRNFSVRHLSVHQVVGRKY
jgi:hypothetical protein